MNLMLEVFFLFVKFLSLLLQPCLLLIQLDLLLELLHLGSYLPLLLQKKLLLVELLTLATNLKWLLILSPWWIRLVLDILVNLILIP